MSDINVFKSATLQAAAECTDDGIEQAERLLARNPEPERLRMLRTFADRQHTTKKLLAGFWSGINTRAVRSGLVAMRALAILPVTKGLETSWEDLGTKNRLILADEFGEDVAKRAIDDETGQYSCYLADSASDELTAADEIASLGWGGSVRLDGQTAIANLTVEKSAWINADLKVPSQYDAVIDFYDQGVTGYQSLPITPMVIGQAITINQRLTMPADAEAELAGVQGRFPAGVIRIRLIEHIL